MQAALLRDFSLLQQYYELYEDGEPVHYGYEQSDLLDQLEIRNEFEALISKKPKDICQLYFSKIPQPESDSKFQLAISLIREGGIDCGKQLVDTKIDTQMMRTVMMECAL